MVQVVGTLVRAEWFHECSSIDAEAQTNATEQQKEIFIFHKVDCSRKRWRLIQFLVNLLW